MTILKNFFDMGGYGAFVWPSYFFTALVLILMLLASLRLLNKNVMTVDSLENSIEEGSGEKKA